MAAPVFHDPDHPERLLVLVATAPDLLERNCFSCISEKLNKYLHSVIFIIREIKHTKEEEMALLGTVAISHANSVKTPLFTAKYIKSLSIWIESAGFN